ncbi:MAG: hypothetical protein WCP55_00835 [Lentisphaerota bacterium]
MKHLIIVGAVVTLIAGCSSTGPVAGKDQTIQTAGNVAINMPGWYVKPPAPTEDNMWFVGTATSSDLAMSREKALLDAQLKLADTLNGVANALIKQQKNDNAGSVVNDKTSITVKKVIANTSLTGYTIEDTTILPENRNYRTFVLLRYPLGDTNRLLKEKLQRENQNVSGDEANQRELDKEIAPRPVTVTPLSGASVSVVTPEGTSTLNLMSVENAEYKARRAEALQKPGAVVGQTSVN